MGTYLFYIFFQLLMGLLFRVNESLIMTVWVKHLLNFWSKRKPSTLYSNNEYFYQVLCIIVQDSFREVNFMLLVIKIISHGPYVVIWQPSWVFDPHKND